jgi:hypothetical protein
VAWLVELVAWLGTALYSAPDSLPAAFWDVHTAARLSAVGEKARPIACGDTLRRLFGRLFCAARKQRIGNVFEPLGQLGVGARGGSERVALMAQVVHEVGGVLLAIDGTNAFNALSRSAVLQAVATHFPELYAYVERVYGPASTPSLQFGLDGFAEAEIILSRQGVQQGDPLGPLLFALAVLPVMLSFREAFPTLALPAYLDDMTIVSLGAADAAVLQLVHSGFLHVAEELEKVGVKVNTTKSVCLLPPGGGAHSAAAGAGVTDGQAHVMLQPVPVRSDGIVLMGVPVGTPAFVRTHMRTALRSAGTDRLLAELPHMTDSQVAYHLLRLCGPARATYLARNVGPAEAGEELRCFDALMLCGLAAVAQEPRLVPPAVPAVGHAAGAAPAPPVPAPQGAAGAVAGAQRPLAWRAAVDLIRSPTWDGRPPVSLSRAQQLHAQLRQRNGGLGLASVARRSAAAYLGRTVEALGPALRAFPAAMQARLRARDGALLFAARTFEHVHTALERMRTCGDATAAALPDLLSPAWCGPWSPAAATPDRARSTARGALLAQVLAVPPPADAASPARTRARAGRAAGATPASAPKRHRQAALSLHQDTAAAQELQRVIGAIADDNTRLEWLARWRSQASTGAMACFAALPSDDAHLSMGPLQFREALRRHMGLERPPPGGLCKRCRQPQAGAHVRRCPYGPNSTRHHKLVDALFALLRSDAKLRGVLKDTDAPFRHGTTYFMDLYVPAGQLDLPAPAVQPAADGAQRLGGGLAVAVCLDVTIRDGTCPTYRREAAADISAGLRAASLNKIKTYVDSGALDPATTTLFSVALDQFGAASQDAHAVVRALAVRQAQFSDGLYTVAACVARWRQKLSVVLQRSISDLVIADWPSTIPATPGAAPDLDAYRHASLLSAPYPPD